MDNNFFDSYHCTSRFHCKSCRDIEDETFRAQLHQLFDDVHEVNFECPHGVPWGAQTEIVQEEIEDRTNDRNIINIDFVMSNRELFEKVEGLDSVIKDYKTRIEKSKCSPCLRARINRGINRAIVAHIQKHKDMRLLNSLNGNLIIADGTTDRQVSEWKSEISNGL